MAPETIAATTSTRLRTGIRPSRTLRFRSCRRWKTDSSEGKAFNRGERRAFAEFAEKPGSKDRRRHSQKDSAYLLTSHLTCAPQLVLPHVPHELRLQSLRTEFAAHVQCAFAVGNLLVPRTQIQHRLIEIHRGGPHEPPAVRCPLQDTAVGTSTTEKRLGGGTTEVSKLHGMNCSWAGLAHCNEKCLLQVEEKLSPIRLQSGFTCR